MLFLPILGFWIANEPSVKPIETSLPPAIGSEVLLDQSLPFDTPIEIKPFVIEGSVENFDPEARAEELAKTFPRKWCGIYSSFDEESNVEVILTFDKASPIGQIVDLKGEMTIGDIKTPIHGNLNAKSDQLELIPLSDKLIPGLEPGGTFISLQGAKLFGWKSSRLDNPGGRLELNDKCDKKISKAPNLITIW